MNKFAFIVIVAISASGCSTHNVFPLVTGDCTYMTDINDILDWHGPGARKVGSGFNVGYLGISAGANFEYDLPVPKEIILDQIRQDMSLETALTSILVVNNSICTPESAKMAYEAINRVIEQYYQWKRLDLFHENENLDDGILTIIIDGRKDEDKIQ